MGEWQPISTAPRDGTWFLGFWPVHTFEDQVKVTAWSPWGPGYDEPRFQDNGDCCDWTQPTHWMPHPGAPA